MTGQDGGFPQAARRFMAEVDSALTRAKRAAREAKAVSEDFRRSTGELGAQAKTGKLRGVRRGEVRATTPESREQAVEFRTANGLPVEELPGADALLARLPAPVPEKTPERDDYSQRGVLFDVDTHEEPAQTADDPVREEEMARIDSSVPEPTRTSDEDEDFSQQRILFDATAETYRPDGMVPSLFEPVDAETSRSEPSAEQRRQSGD